MRTLNKQSIEQRGCKDCAEVTKEKKCGRYTWVCNHDHCPYNELDTITNYKTDYLGE